MVDYHFLLGTSPYGQIHVITMAVMVTINNDDGTWYDNNIVKWLHDDVDMANNNRRSNVHHSNPTVVTLLQWLELLSVVTLLW